MRIEGLVVAEGLNKGVEAEGFEPFGGRAGGVP